MPTLDLSQSPPASVADEPLDGFGCHVLTLAMQGRSQGWLRRVGPPGEKSPLLSPTRVVDDYKRLGAGRRKVYTGLADGTYEADTALDNEKARRVTFRVENGAFVLSELLPTL